MSTTLKHGLAVHTLQRGLSAKDRRVLELQQREDEVR
jgi:hypothetical protein